MADAIVEDLGRRLFVQLDPAWPWTEYAISGSPNSSTKLSAVFMDLDQGVTEAATVRYVDIDILGRGEPVKVWVGNGAREVSLMFRFRAQGAKTEYIRAGGSNMSAIERATASQAALNEVTRQTVVNNSIVNALQQEVQQPARFLDWLRYPYIDDHGVSHGPPPVYLSIGRLLRMRCVVGACAITWLSPWDVDTMLPHGADVAVTFCSVSTRMGNYSPSGPTRIQPAGLVEGLNPVDGG